MHVLDFLRSCTQNPTTRLPEIYEDRPPTCMSRLGISVAALIDSLSKKKLFEMANRRNWQFVDPVGIAPMVPARKSLNLPLFKPFLPFDRSRRIAKCVQCWTPARSGRRPVGIVKPACRQRLELESTRPLGPLMRGQSCQGRFLIL